MYVVTNDGTRFVGACNLDRNDIAAVELVPEHDSSFINVLKIFYEFAKQDMAAFGLSHQERMSQQRRDEWDLSKKRFERLSQKLGQTSQKGQPGRRGEERQAPEISQEKQDLAELRQILLSLSQKITSFEESLSRKDV